MTRTTKKILAVALVLAIITTTDPENVRAADTVYSVEDIMLLAAAMQLENGSNSDKCLLYTGSVILNRVKHPRFPNTIKGVLFQRGQYAEHTKENLYKIKVSDRVLSLALKLATCGSMDESLIFQSMQPRLGKVKYIIDGEFFATE